MEYDNSNTGFLAKNDRKQKDTHPDYQGSINVGGTEYWLSGWLKEGKAGGKMEGKKFFSLSVKPKEDQPQQAPASRAAPASIPDDDIPF